MAEEERSQIQTFLDEEWRIKSWPGKRSKQTLLLAYLAAALEGGRTYTQKEIDAFWDARHLFDDRCLLRREMVEARLLARTRDGRTYWLAERE